jgi:hypothetical protein
MRPRHIEKLRERTAELSVGASTVRNAGARGVVRASRRALKSVNLAKFAVGTRSRFLKALERETQKVRLKLPPGARHWGVARKVLNIFLRSCVYSRLIARAYGLSQVERWLELPLDSQVANGIHVCSRMALPRWQTIKGLESDVSVCYQNAAASLARRLRVHPIHLETCWWREDLDRCKCAV